MKNLRKLPYGLLNLKNKTNIKSLFSIFSYLTMLKYRLAVELRFW